MGERNWFKPSSKIFYWPFQGGTSFVDHLWVFCVLCFSCFRVCLLLPCGHLLGWGWPLGSCWWCLLYLCYFPMWYPGSGVVLDSIISCRLSYFAEHHFSWLWSVSENDQNSWTAWHIWIKFCILILWVYLSLSVCGQLLKMLITGCAHYYQMIFIFCSFISARAHVNWSK